MDSLRLLDFVFFIVMATGAMVYIVSSAQERERGNRIGSFIDLVCASSFITLFFLHFYVIFLQEMLVGRV